MHTLQFRASHSPSRATAARVGRGIDSQRPGAESDGAVSRPRPGSLPCQGGQGWLVQGTLGDLAQDPVSASPSFTEASCFHSLSLPSSENVQVFLHKGAHWAAGPLPASASPRVSDHVQAPGLDPACGCQTMKTACGKPGSAPTQLQPLRACG